MVTNALNNTLINSLEKTITNQFQMAAEKLNESSMDSDQILEGLEVLIEQHNKVITYTWMGVSTLLFLIFTY